MENATIALDSTVRSQDSSNSKDSKESCASDLKPESCLESKHSKEILISEKQQRQQQPRTQQHPDDRQKLRSTEPKDDSNLLMFTSCGQLLLGVVLVVFGILVLVHGAALGGSGAGLWAGVGALVAGALGVVATLATSSSKTNSSFSTAHLAASLVALALSNMAAITALTAIVRDSQRTPEVTLLTVPDENSEAADVENSWAGLLASIGLLVTSVAELLVSGYSCLTLTPKLCGCLRASNVDEVTNDGRLKTRNMVHQWVTAQNHVPKSQPIYVVQPMLPMHPMIQVRPDPLPRPFVLGYYGSTSGELESPYAMAGGPAKFPGGFVPAGPLPIAAPAYGAVPMLPHMPYAARPPSQIIRPKQKRHITVEHEDTMERKKQTERKTESPKRMSSIGEDQVDLAQTYTGLDKKISEEFISIAMDPERKSKASSSHGSEIGTAKTS
ncbi:uncharacterized protein LOC117237064 isoform X1 [Bombus vosnesenskii]|uniref:Uncharacterized protein LOC117237064 isoform X1 n=2 Tax=Pyrobombus TaxID=144703 RepID=A0A6J3KWP9_9HYME|nr:uncharacterized protein LOC100742823 isoform X1 [Bombus impatiens]XP_033356566.1 uncharacterized protein LOC117237064 isoform X1 [Bombus vosnesenskii]XP_050476295.1 uncharacterized protein LOC126866567 isoform X1 [Bombus huntii]